MESDKHFFGEGFLIQMSLMENFSLSTFLKMPMSSCLWLGFLVKPLNTWANWYILDSPLHQVGSSNMQKEYGCDVSIVRILFTTNWP